MANYKIKNEVTNGTGGYWRLCFQWGTYHYDDGTTQKGYRFIWRRPNGHLQAARGQARIPSGEDIFELLTLATKAGWFIKVE